MKKKSTKMTKAKLKKLEKRERNMKDREWQNKVKQRDGYRCIICGVNKIVHTHHLIPREVKGFRWDVDNGVTLCPKHHKFSLLISPHRNPLVFYKWLLENRLEQLRSLENKYELNFGEAI